MNIKKYVEALRKDGHNIIYEGGDHYWINYESKSSARGPAFILDEPTKEEISKVFDKLKPLVLTYNVLPRSQDDSNSFLYITTDREYSLEKIDKNARRFTRIAQRNLDIKFTDWDNILSNGFQAYSDTRNRNGLSDGKIDNFKRIFTECKNNNAFKTIAAFEPGTNRIYAFLKMIVVDNWVEITSSYSESDYLNLCPNNGMFNAALEFYLAGGKADVVSYGVSSIQKDSKKEGLHNFKVRVGFEAKPVQRIFIVNPKYKFLFNGFTHKTSRILLKIFPSNRQLKKIDGVMNLILSENEDN